MSTVQPQPVEPTAPPEAKAGAMQLAAPRNPATKINRKFLIVSLGTTGVALAIFFGARIADAAAHQQKISDPATKAPVAPPPNLKPPNYADTVIAQAGDGTPSVAMPCSQYPGYANCTPDADLPGAAAAATTGAGGQGQASQLAQQQANQLAQQQAAEQQEAYQRANAARSAGVFFPGSQGGGGAAEPASSPPPAAFIPTSAEGGPGGPNVLGGSGQDEKRAFARTGETDDYIRGQLEAPRSPYEVKAGSIIPAALVTAINSDLPGEIVAQVTQPVYDHITGRFLLIPQGARLIGQYDSQVAWGQDRALITWNRIVFPNGYSINIGTMEGADQGGASGLTDRVNHHWGTVAAGVLVSAILSVGSSAAQGAASGDNGVTVINTGASTAASDASRVGERIVDKGLNRQPTIQVRAGYPLRVLVNKDIILEPYR